MKFWILFFTMLGPSMITSLQAKVYDITVFGARGDSATLNTGAIQKAIDECAANGGGTVNFPAGAYISGTLFLKDHTHLYLEAGAKLICSTDVSQFPMQTSKMVSLRPNNYSLIYAENRVDLTISGSGMIIGQGDKAPYHIRHQDQDASVVRPKVICMIGCKNVQVKDVTLKNSPSWMQHYLDCEDLLIEEITVSNRRSSVNNDGIDIDGCRNVRIIGCNVDSEDDAIVMKSTSDKLCENITITGCILTSHCNALKCGTESSGGFRNISITGCVIFDTYLSGIALEIVDGGIMDLVNISNITMNRVNNPLFIKLGNRARPYTQGIEKPGIGEIRNIQISHIQASEVGEFQEKPDMEFSHHNARPLATAIFIDGLPEKKIQNIMLSDFYINYKGGGTSDDTVAEVPVNAEAYPEYSSYGSVRPAYGFFGRNVSQMYLTNIRVSFEKPDYRPAFIFDHLDHLQMENLEGEKADKAQPVLKLTGCREAYLQKSPALDIKDILCDSYTRLFINGLPVQNYKKAENHENKFPGGKLH